VDPVEFIGDITFKMCDRDLDLDLVESTYADDFVHHGNGATTDKALYLERGRVYREQYASIDRPSSTSSSRSTIAWWWPTRSACTATTARSSGPAGVAARPGSPKMGRGGVEPPSLGL
jgi:hypothetical protein